MNRQYYSSQIQRTAASTMSHMVLDPKRQVMIQTMNALTSEQVEIIFSLEREGKSSQWSRA